MLMVQKMMGGHLNALDVEQLAIYMISSDFPRFSNMTLSEIIEWFSSQRDPDLDYLNKMLYELRQWREYDLAMREADKKRPR